MNAEWVLPRVSPRNWSGFSAFAERHPVWMRAALANFALLAVCVVASFVDERTLNGVSVWSKPFKFSLSLGVYFATLAWFAPLLPNGYLEARKGRLLTWIPVVCAVIEMAYIVVQASRGQASHFNLTTPFYAAMYSLMGLGALSLVAVCLWLGSAILRSRGVRDPYALAVGVGLILTFVLGGGFGGYLSSQMGHWVGGTHSDANGLWLVHWSRDGGDLRVAHFFGMHAMQALPVIGASAARWLSPANGVALVVATTLVYVLATAFTFVQAIDGVPFM